LRLAKFLSKFLFNFAEREGNAGEKIISERQEVTTTTATATLVTAAFPRFMLTYITRNSFIRAKYEYKFSTTEFTLTIYLLFARRIFIAAKIKSYFY